MALRELDLPEGAAGRLWLSAMPGRARPWPEDLSEIRAKGIACVVRLTSDRETGDKSPSYLDAIRHGLLPWEELHLPMPDYGVPADWGRFVEVLGAVKARLAAGKGVLVHCAAGIGRTGTMASAILISLGVDPLEASRRVGRAGSYAEDEAQVGFLLEVARASKRPGA
jgi:protein-tyrosine phosphatase